MLNTTNGGMPQRHPSSLLALAMADNSKLYKQPCMWTPEHLQALGVVIHEDQALWDYFAPRKEKRICHKKGVIGYAWIHFLSRRLGSLDVQEKFERCLKCTIKSYRTDPSIQVREGAVTRFSFGSGTGRVRFPLLVTETRSEDPLLAFISEERLDEMQLRVCRGSWAKVRSYHRKCQQQEHLEKEILEIPRDNQVAQRIPHIGTVSSYVGFLVAMAQRKYELDQNCASHYLCVLVTPNEKARTWCFWVSEVPRDFIEAFIENDKEFIPGLDVDFCDIAYSDKEGLLEFLGHALGIVDKEKASI